LAHASRYGVNAAFLRLSATSVGTFPGRTAYLAAGGGEPDRLEQAMASGRVREQSSLLAVTPIVLDFEAKSSYKKHNQTHMFRKTDDTRLMGTEDGHDFFLWTTGRATPCVEVCETGRRQAIPDLDASCNGSHAA
jgi:hypothetical protein